MLGRVLQNNSKYVRKKSEIRFNNGTCSGCDACADIFYASPQTVEILFRDFSGVGKCIWTFKII